MNDSALAGPICEKTHRPLCSLPAGGLASKKRLNDAQINIRLECARGICCFIWDVAQEGVRPHSRSGGWRSLQNAIKSAPRINACAPRSENVIRNSSRVHDNYLHFTLSCTRSDWLWNKFDACELNLFPESATPYQLACKIRMKIILIREIFYLMCFSGSTNFNFLGLRSIL